MNISDEISRLAQEYDPEREADAKATRAFTQGMLFAEMAKQLPSNPNRIIKVIDLEQEKDADGNYLPYFTVVYESGARIRITLEVE